MSNVGFVGVVDLLLGVRVDSQSFARLIWASPGSSDAIKLRQYLLQRALAAYDSALVRKMPDVIEETVRATQEEISRRGISLQQTRDIDELEKAHDALDRMENHFFQRMREEMDRSDAKRPGKK